MPGRRAVVGPAAQDAERVAAFDHPRQVGVERLPDPLPVGRRHEPDRATRVGDPHPGVEQLLRGAPDRRPRRRKPA